MKNITDEQIKQHIINVVNNELEFFIDSSLMNDYKRKITDGKDSNEVDYIAKKIISDMDRHLVNIEKHNFDINKIDLSSLVEYLKGNNFPFKEYLQEAIENKLYKSFMFSENCNEILDMNSFIGVIVSKLHILNLVKQDEHLNVARKRDDKKIKNAIDTLLQYTNDEQVKFYLNSIEMKNRDITTSTILQCIFCSLYKTLEEILLPAEEVRQRLSESEKRKLPSKNKIQDHIHSVMNSIFSETKTVTEYRYYTNIEIIKYKGYKLRKFVKTKKLK